MTSFGFPNTLFDMTAEAFEIANKVRGVTAERRFTQKRIADILGITRGSVSSRMNGSVPFSADELWTLSGELGVDIRRLFPDREQVQS